MTSSYDFDYVAKNGSFEPAIRVISPQRLPSLEGVRELRYAKQTQIDVLFKNASLTRCISYLGYDEQYGQYNDECTHAEPEKIADEIHNGRLFKTSRHIVTYVGRVSRCKQIRMENCFQCSSNAKPTYFVLFQTGYRAFYICTTVVVFHPTIPHRPLKFRGIPTAKLCERTYDHAIKANSLSKSNIASKFRRSMLQIAPNARRSRADEPSHHPQVPQFIHEYLRKHLIRLGVS
ncbi:hypothetical protein CLF_106816 [Clonorchis sinensis]|uniref:Uncharacterized protein n=1 Tax=Clonorchis sinensis TaxID=79923 RepID=G7YFS0_CLOSI|nr:hypothetical protein CLF_106816 [Clonorchis sinensis]